MALLVCALLGGSRKNPNEGPASARLRGYPTTLKAQPTRGQKKKPSGEGVRGLLLALGPLFLLRNDRFENCEFVNVCAEHVLEKSW